MRIRVLKSVAMVYGTFQVGDVHDIPDDMARDWCQAGIAMQDKSLDGASETKEGDLYWCEECGRSHKTDSEIGKSHYRGRHE